MKHKDKAYLSILLGLHWLFKNCYKAATPIPPVELGRRVDTLRN